MTNWIKVRWRSGAHDYYELTPNSYAYWSIRCGDKQNNPFSRSIIMWLATVNYGTVLLRSKDMAAIEFFEISQKEPINPLEHSDVYNNPLN